MRKTFLILALAFLLVLPLASAFEWDNVKSYDARTKEATIINAFGMGSDLMKIKLLENTQMCSGDCHAILEFNNYEEVKLSSVYDSTFGFEFDDLLNARQEKQIVHGFQIATAQTIKQVVVGTECPVDEKNVTIEKDCKYTYANETTYDWKDFDFKDYTMPVGHFYLRLWGQKEMNESIDWIPSLIGVKIDDWAKWTTVSAIGNFTFDEATLGDNTGTGFMSVNYSGWIRNTSVFIDGSAVTTSYASWANNSYNTQTTIGGWSFWMRPSINSSLMPVTCMFTHDDSGNLKGDFDIGFQNCNGAGTGGALSFMFNNITDSSVHSVQSTTTNFVAGKWYYIFLKLNATATQVWVNGVKEASEYGSPNQAFFGNGRKTTILSAPANWDVSIKAFNGTADELKFFNVEITESQIVSINNTEAPVTTLYPAPNITFPTNTSYNYNSFTINYTAVNGIDCWYTKDGGVTNSTGVLCGINFTGVTANQGSNNWSVWANSSTATKNVSATISFTVDSIIPLVKMTNPTNTTYNANVTVFNYTSSDTNLDKCWYSTDFGTTNTTITCGTNVSTGIASIEGNNTWTIWVNDTIGNTNSSTITFTQDTSMPSVKIVIPTNSTYSSMTFLNWTASNPNLNTCWYSVNGGTTNTTITCGTNVTGLSPTEGANTWKVWANATTGNTNSSSVTFTFDTIQPLIGMTFPANASYNYLPNTINYSASDTNLLDTCWYSTDSGTTNTSIACGVNATSLTAGQGNNRWIVWANDSANNINTSARSFFVDSIIPQIKITNPTNITYDTHSITLNYTSSDTNLDKCWYSVDNGITNVTLTCGTNASLTASEGANTWKVWDNDTLGNTNSSSITFETDTLTPVVNILFPAASGLYNYKPTSLNYSITHATGVLSTCWYSLNSGTTNITLSACGVNATGILAAEGANTWTVWSNDTANNAGHTTIIFTTDTINPFVNMTYPKNASYNYKPTTLNYSASDANLESCYYSVDGGTTNVTLSACGVNATGLTSSEGANTWIIWANDTLGNTNKSQRTFLTDTLYPKISIVFPENLSYNYDVTELNFTVSDANLETCWYSTDEGTTNTSITCGNNVTGLTSSQGSNIWKVWANDTVGNTNSSTITFFVDTIFPNIKIKFPTNTTYNLNTLDLNYTVADVNLETCWYSTDSGTINTTLTCGTNVSLSTTEGSNIWKVWANDTVGNTNSSSITFTIDTSAPVVNITYPANTTYNAQVKYFNWTINEGSPDVCIVSNATTNTTVPCQNSSIPVITAWGDTNWSSTFPDDKRCLDVIGGTDNWRDDPCDTNAASQYGICEFNEGQYQISASHVNWTDAQTYCNNLGIGWHLATANTTAEFKNFSSICSGGSWQCWLNAYNDTADDTWKWANWNWNNFLSIEGSNFWTVWANDSYGNTNRTSIAFTVKTTKPDIHFVAPTLGDGANSTTGVIQINVTSADANLANITINLFDSTNTLILNQTTATSPNFLSYTAVNGIYYYNATACDIVSNCNSTETRMINVTNLFYTENFLSPVYAGTINNFMLNVTYQSSIYSIAGTLVYNNTLYSGSAVENGDNAVITRAITAPPVTAGTNISFYWFVTLTNSSGFSQDINLTFHNQTVLPIALSTACGAGSYDFINISNYDEELLTQMNGTIEYTIDLLNSNQSFITEVNGTVFGENVTICSSENITGAGTLVTAQLRYYASNYSYETYNLQNTPVDTLPLMIRLYFLNSTSGTKFNINYIDFNYLTHPNAIIQVQRQYLSLNLFNNVEIPKIDSNGVAQATFSTNNVRYKLIVIDNGITIDTFDDIFPVCQSVVLGQCNLNLRGKKSAVPNVGDDFSYTLFQSNDSVTLTYTIPSGTPKAITFSTMQNSRFLNNISQCTTTVFSSGGTIICPYNNTVGDSVINLVVYTNGNATAYGQLPVSEDLSGFYSLNNFIIGFILLLTLGLIFISSGMMIVVMAAVGVLFLGIVFLIKGAGLTTVATSLMWLIIAAVIIVYKVAQKEERT